MYVLYVWCTVSLKKSFMVHSSQRRRFMTYEMWLWDSQRLFVSEVGVFFLVQPAQWAVPRGWASAFVVGNLLVLYQM